MEVSLLACRKNALLAEKMDHFFVEESKLTEQDRLEMMAEYTL